MLRSVTPMICATSFTRLPLSRSSSARFRRFASCSLFPYGLILHVMTPFRKLILKNSVGSAGLFIHRPNWDHHGCTPVPDLNTAAPPNHAICAVNDMLGTSASGMHPLPGPSELCEPQPQ